MKLSEFYTSISSGRTDEEYFLSKNDFSDISGNFLISNHHYHDDQISLIYSSAGEGRIDINDNQILLNVINGGSGDEHSLKLYDEYILLNNNAQNTAGGLVILNESGKIPLSLILNYQISNTFMLSAGVYFDCTQTPLSNITFTFDKSMNDSMCLFKTDSTITFNFSYPQNGGIYINEPINLDPDSIYLISMENNVITWTDLIDAVNLLN